MGQSQSTPKTLKGSEPGAKWRALANHDADKRRELSQQSQDAWNSNNRARAKELSLLAKTHQTSMERHNALAASEIFAHHNPSYLPPPPSTLFSLVTGLFPTFFSLVTGLFSSAASSPSAGLVRIDLHGLRVAEALERVKAHLVLCRQNSVDRTTIITGRGLHSRDGVAKIRPVVEKLLVESQVKLLRDHGNEGAFIVELGVEQGEEGQEGWGEWLKRGLFGRG